MLIKRLDHGHKRATDQDRHPNAATSNSAQQEEVEEQGNKRPRLDEEATAVAVAEEVSEVAEEDEDSEPSSDEDDD